MTQSQVMQSTGDLHHHVPDRVSPVAQFLLDDTTALHAAHRMLNSHLFACDAAILHLLLRCQFTTTWFLGRLLDRHVLDGKSLKSHVLIQDTSSRQDIRFIVNNRFVMPLPSIGSTQKANVAVFINQEDILDRVTLLLSTIILILLISIYGPLNGAFRTIMIKKGAPSSVEPSFSASTVARRGGIVSSCWSA